MSQPTAVDAAAKALTEARGTVADIVNMYEDEILAALLRDQRKSDWPAEIAEELQEALQSWRNAGQAFLETVRNSREGG